MSITPRDSRFDSTFQLWKAPYDYIGRECAKLGTDVFEARIMFQRTLCMKGPEAARLFYDSEHFERRNAAPEPVQATLFGKGGIQGLDGTAHHHRKALFMRILNAQRVNDLAEETRKQWEIRSSHWAPYNTVALYESAQDVLVRAVFHWASVPILDQTVVQRKRELVSLFDDAARGIRPHMRSRLARYKLEGWLQDVIGSVRNGRIQADPDTVLHNVATYHDENDKPLDLRIAAVELLNILRPIIAVSVYIVWCAHALQNHPAARDAMLTGDKDYQRWFLHEVRRYYPFFPVLAARVRKDFEWNSFYFRKGQRALLDLYGTNHDPRTWNEPAQFNPERFRNVCPGQFELVPQGGGDPAMHHRCPGEDVALTLMKVSTEFLIHQLSGSLVSPDLRINKKRLPALPCSALLLAACRT